MCANKWWGKMQQPCANSNWPTNNNIQLRKRKPVLTMKGKDLNTIRNKSSSCSEHCHCTMTGLHRCKILRQYLSRECWMIFSRKNRFSWIGLNARFVSNAAHSLPASQHTIFPHPSYMYRQLTQYYNCNTEQSQK